MSALRSSAPLRICLFVGPSVPPTELRAAAAQIEGEVRILPPAEQGDLLRLLPDLPDVIGIIDGMFFSVPAPLHKEILIALEHGARVLGAASLGALRAAELDVFGMEGVGTIYRMFRRGRLVDDGEVAVLHEDAEAGFRPLSVPLVNVRHNLTRARRRGVVSRKTAASVLAGATRIYFAERTYEAILRTPEAAACPTEEIVALRRFIADEAVDLKRRDALDLISTIAARSRGRQPWPSRPPVTTPRTAPLERYLREYVGRDAAGRDVPDALVLGFEKLLRPDMPELRREVVRRCLAVETARALGVSARSPALLLDEHRRRERLSSDAALDAWLAERELTLAELLTGLGERDLEWQVVALASSSPHPAPATESPHRRAVAGLEARTGLSEAELTRPLLMGPGLSWDQPLTRELKLRGEFRAGRERAVRIVQFAEISPSWHPDATPLRLKHAWIQSWCAARWGVEVADLGQASVDRGFASAKGLDAVAVPAYVYEHFGPTGGL